MFNWFKRLFRKPPPPEREKTAPLTDELDLEELEAPTTVFPVQFQVGSALSPGRQRDHNEDALLVINTVMADNDREVPFGIFIVADGMGGHQHGEQASAIAARTLARFLLRQLYLGMLQVPPKVPEASLQELMQEGVLQANRTVVEAVPGGGSTLSAVVALGEQMLIGHVGDSRISLLYPERRVEVLTRDHSLVQRLVELDQLTPEEAAIHPQRSVLYRALGQEEGFAPDVLIRPFPPMATLLICSDGLWSVVPDQQILDIVLREPDLTQAAGALVEAANAAGGPDNISVILVRKRR